jgi:hypothetical protein
MNVLHEPIIALTLRLSVKPLSPPSRKTGRVGVAFPKYIRQDVNIYLTSYIMMIKSKT